MSHRLIRRTALLGLSLLSISARVLAQAHPYPRQPTNLNPSVCKPQLASYSSIPYNHHPTSTMTEPSNTPENKNEPPNSTSPSTSTPLALPEAPSSSSADTNKLDLSSGSSSVKLDHLGPLVVNQDGSLSRIANWEQMTEIEKKNTLRVLGKRNQLRMAQLRGTLDTADGKEK